MYKNKEIFLKEKPIHTIKDLLDASYDPRTGSVPLTSSYPVNCLPSELSVLNSMLKHEIILYQIKFRNNTMHLPYSFKDMIDAQSYLEILDCVESVKYAPYIVNTRQLLYKYLYSLYHISSFNLYRKVTGKKEGFCLDTEIINDMKILSTKVDIFVHSNIDINNPFSPSKTIQNLFSDFLSKVIGIPASLYSHCGLYPAMTKINLNKSSCQRLNAEVKNSQRRYLPIYDIPIFLLLFCYYDHRNFDYILFQSNAGRLPKKKLQGTAIYRLIIQQAKEYKLFDSFSSVSYFLRSCQWRCDNIFLFYKLATLFKYYNLYTSDTTLNDIIQSYKWSYTEIMTLKEFIVEEIFYDKDFILKGLTSKYLDFMLPFNIFFQCNIYLRHPGGTYDTFKNNLIDIKEKTKKIYDIDLPLTCPKIKRNVLVDGLFHISEMEKSLNLELSKNDFYKEYYSCNPMLLFKETDSKTDNVYAFVFQVAKQALEQTTGIHIEWK